MGLALRRTVHAPFVMNKLRWTYRYEADLLTGADDDAVSSWADQSGFGRTLTQATADAQPILKLDILNGHRVVRFDGGDDRMTAVVPALAQPYVFVIAGIVRSTPVSANGFFASFSTANATVTTGGLAAISGGTSLTGPAVSSAPIVFSGLYTGATSRVRVNGAETIGNANTGATATTVAIGNGFGGTTGLALDAAFLGMLPFQPTGWTWRRLERELRCRFGI